MKITHFIPFVLLSLAGLHTAPAATPPKATATQSDRVLSVGKDSVTVQTSPKAGFKVTDIDIDGKRTTERASNVVVYHVSPLTEINVDGLPSKLTDIKKGMKILVTAGMTRTDAESIVANTIPPPVPKASPRPGQKAAVAAKGRTSAKEGFRKITSDKVLSISSGRITVGQDGAAMANAYLITPVTTITVDGKPATAAEIQPGMDVAVTLAGQSTAATIHASTPTKL